MYEQRAWMGNLNFVSYASAIRNKNNDIVGFVLKIHR